MNQKRLSLYKLILVFGFLLGGLFQSFAQEVSPFAPRLNGGNVEIRGDIIFVGNNILNRATETNPAQANTPYNGNENNNGLWMEYIDIDNDPASFSSSSAELNIADPACSQVRYAGLYWAATYPNERSTNANQPFTGTPRIEDWFKVKFKIPGGSYVDLTADTAADPVGQEDDIIFDGYNYTNINNSFKDSPYVCYKNVTDFVRSNVDPTGEYTVANVRATKAKRSGGSSAGWVMVIIYENPNESGKFISTFDGYAGISGSTGDVDVAVNGFRTLPTPFPVRARIGVGALEGDRGINKDQFRIKANSTTGAFTQLSTGENPGDNFFNSTITTNGSQVTTRTPYGTNTLGTDLDLFNLNNPSNSVLPNGESGATLRFTTGSDGYGPFLATFAVEIIEPNIVLEKRVEDIAGNDITDGGVNLGQTLDYVLSFRNLGNDDAINHNIRDVLPKNTTFDSFDVSGAPGVMANYDAAANEVNFSVPDNLVQIGDPVYNIRLRVKVASNCYDFVDACTNQIQNLAYSTYQGDINSAVITDDPSVSDFDNCGFETPGATNFLLDDLSGCNFIRTVQLCGANTVLNAGDGFDSYVWVRDDNNNGAIDASDPVQNDGDPDGDPSTLLVTDIGTYIVDKIVADPCKSFQEIITVERFGSTQTNPIIDYFNDLNSDADPTNDIQGEIVTCSVDGDLLPKIFLCGANDLQLMQINITDAQSLSWEKLNETSCTAAPDECANKNLGCSWSQVASGNNYTADTAGKYRLVINYTNGCFSRFYFDVFQNNLEVLYPTPRDIICTTNGNITITGPSSNYGYRLIDYANSTILIDFAAGHGPSFDFAPGENGSYRVETVQLDASGNPIPGACIFSTDPIGIRERDFQVDITTTPANCNAQGKIKIDVLNVRADYTYMLKRADGTLIDDETAQSNNTHTFNVTPGSYIVETSTEDGCTNTQNISVGRTPDPTLSALTTKDISCSAGTIELTRTGGQGNPDFLYAIWSKDGTDLYPNVTSIPADAYQVDPTFTFGWRDDNGDGTDEYILGEDGMYEFVIIDANNCFAFSKQVTITDIGAMVIDSISETQPSCNGNTDGTLTLNISGGVGPFQYSIDDGATYQNTDTFVNLAAGDYNLRVTDTSGCDVRQTYAITEPNALTAEALQTQNYTCNQPGEISVGSVKPAAGGSGSYQYSISGGTWTAATSGGAVFTNLTDGTYTVHVRDANAVSCSLSLPDIVIDALPTAPAPTDSVSYNCDGTGNITVSPDDPTYTYSLNGGTAQGPNIFNNVATGNHTVTIDYGSDCTVDVPVVVQTGQMFTANITGSTSASCNGENDGSITFTVSNFDAATGFEYSTDDGTTYSVLMSSPVTTPATLSAGSQTVLVRKVNDTSCSTSLTRTITEPTAVMVDANITTPFSCNNTGATITASAADGIAPYEYRLEDTSGGVLRPYQTTTTFSNLGEGNYIVRAKDDNGCKDEIDTPIIITAPAAIAFTAVPTLCYSGAGDAIITVNVTGGNGGLLFGINGNPFESPNAATPNSYTFDNLGSGSYTIRVQDQLGCTPASQSFDIAPQVTVTASAKPIPACGTTTTQVTMTAAGGNTTYVYALVNNGATPAPGDFTTSNTRTISAKGDYDVYARDKNGNTGFCEDAFDLSITQDSPLTIAVSNTPLKCSGASQSNLSIDPTGGGAPYRYSIDNGATYQTTDTFFNLPAGSYDIRVRDVNGCETAEIYTISEPFTLSASALVAELIECSPALGAEVRIVNARGGTAPYEYSFDGGATYGANNISNLFPGDHDVFLKDASNCTLAMQVTVLPPQVPPGITTDFEYFCNGDATITVNPDDPDYDYTFEIDSVLNTPEDSNVFTDVAPGDHVVTVNYIITTVTPPSTLMTEDFGFGSNTPISEIDPVYCFEPQNGSPSCPGFGTNTNLEDGEYVVTQKLVGPYGTWINPNDHTGNTDGRYLAINVGGVAGVGGIVYAKRNVEVLPNQDISISLWALNLLKSTSSGGDPSFEIQLVDSSGNVIAATTTGNVPKNTGPDDWYNYSVDLNPGGNTDLDIVIRTNSAVTDGNDITIDDILATQPPAKCPAEVSVDVIVEAGKALEANITATSNVSCNGASDGSVTFNVKNFNAPTGFEYSTDGGTTFIGPETGPVTLNGLTAGMTTVVVRDVADNTCSVSITPTLSEPNALAATAAISAPYTCDMPGATITASATGGTPTYQYQLENTGGTIITAYQTTTTFTNVPIGDYIVRSRDFNGCIDIIDAPVAIEAPSNPTFTAVPTSCYSGNNDATIQVGVTSGNAKYQFKIDGGPWLTPTSSTALTYTFQSLTSGTYTINVKDQYGCIGTPQDVTVNPSLTATAVLDPDLSCLVPAKITITANGGSGNYSYEWSDDSGATYATTNFTGNEFNTTNDGTYIFRVTDTSTAGTCNLVTVPITVTPAQTPVITSVTPTNILCNGELTGTLDVVIDTSIGRPQYTIEVLETNTSTDYGARTLGLPAGDYEVRITDDKGCVSSPFPVSITEPNAIVYNINLVPITCDSSTGTTPGSITVENLAGGTSEYTYYLTGNNSYSDTYATTAGGEDHTFAILEFGIYEVDVVDTNGCSLRKTNIIASPPDDLDIDVSITTVDCTTGGTAIVTVSSAVSSHNYKFAILETYSSPYSTSYQPADTTGGDTATFTGLIPGVTYTFVVHDSTTDCYYFETAATPVNSPSSMTAILDNVANVTCKGAADGNVTFTFDNYDAGATAVGYEIFKAQSNVTAGFAGNSSVNPPTGAIQLSNFAALPPGVYYILLKEVGGSFSGCSISSSNFTISESSEVLQVTAASPKNDNCNTDAGTITAQAQFGTAPYEFQYLLDTATAPTATSIGWTSDTFANVESGDYIVYVKDANDCIQMDAVTVVLDPTPKISLSIVNECVEEGVFEVTVTLDVAGISPYQLSLNGAAYRNITFNTSNKYTLTGLSSGVNQTVEVRDLNGNAGCPDPKTFTIHPPLQFNVRQTQLLDCEDAAAAYAEITIEVTSGSGDYEYQIDGPGAIGQARTTLPGNPYKWPNASAAGDYSVSVWDINTSSTNCVETLVIDVPKAVIPEFEETNIDVICNGGNNGSISLQEINNGTNPLEYTLTPMPAGAVLNGNTFENLPAGTYDVRGLGTNGCSDNIFDIVIAEPIAITVPTPTVKEFACTTGNNSDYASITVSGVTGGSGTFTRYEFINNDNPATTTVVDPIVVQEGANNKYIEPNVLGGTYTINVFDTKGCVGTQSAIIQPYDELLTATTTITNPISCNPGNDGEITVSVTSAENDLSKFEYSIDNGATYQTSNVFPNLGIGTYVFQIRHIDTRCIISVSETLKDPNTFTIDIDKISEVVCFGTASGEITLALVDATYVGGFDWEIFNTNGTSADLTDDTSVDTGSEAANGPTAGIKLSVGSYYVTMSQSNAPTCENTAFFTISGPTAAITGDTKKSDITCNFNDGKIEIINVLGGWGGYTYFVDLATNPVPTDATGFQTNPLFENLSGGVAGTDYQVWIADSKGCLHPLPNVNLIDPTDISADLQINVENCTNFEGEIEVINVTGGQGSNYRYQLQMFDTTSSIFENIRPMQTSDVFGNLGAGRYQVIISDQWDCEGTTSAPIELYDEIAPLATVVKTIDCTVDPGGQVTISQKGGSTGAFTYTVTFPDGSTPQPSNTSGIFTKLIPFGEYTFTVADDRSCKKTIKKSLQKQVDPVVRVDSFTDVVCFGEANGTISVSVLDNGVGPYTFQITDKDGTTVAIDPTDSTDTTAEFTGLANTVSATGYTITATGSNDCPTTITQTMTQPSATVNVPAPVMVSFGCSTGNVTEYPTIDIVGVMGGSGVYTRYQFINNDDPETPTVGDAIVVQDGANSTYTETNLAGGNYTINVFDNRGCTSFTTTTINPFAGISNPVVTVGNSVTCNTFDEEITVSVTVNPVSATPNLEYTVSGLNVTYNETNLTGNFIALGVGNYAIFVTNLDTGCVVNTVHSVADPDVIEVTAKKLTDEECLNDGVDDGSFEVTISKYSGNYSYQVYDNTNNPVVGATYSGLGNTSTGSIPIVNLPGGLYYIRITETEAPFCVEDSKIITVLKPNAPITADIRELPRAFSVTCSNDQGRILVDPEGGKGPYTIELENTTTSQNYIKTNVEAFIFSGLSAGDFDVTVTDAFSCVFSEAIIVIRPEEIDATITQTALTCYNGATASVTASIDSGRNVTSPDYRYRLNKYDNAARSNPPQTSAPQTSASFKRLAAGFYSITVTDNVSCSKETAIVKIVNPSEVKAQLIRTSPLTCATGVEFELSATGGLSGQYEYRRVGSSTWITMAGSSVDLPVVGELPLDAGTYRYEVRDRVNTCTAVRSGSIKEDVIEPLTLTVDKSAAVVSCNGNDTAIIYADAEGGLGNYKYELYTDATLNAASLVAGPQRSGRFSGLAADTYYVNVTSGNATTRDCTASAQMVFIDEPLPLDYTDTVTNVSCNGESDGSITVTLSGGSGDYQYAISPNLNQFDDENTFDNLALGNYRVIAQDRNGCFVELQYTITEPLVLRVTASTLSEICAGERNGSIELNITGGTAPYSNRFSDEVNFVQDRPVLSGLASGDYILFIKDAMGCEENIVVSVDPGVNLNATVDSVYGCDGNLSTNYVNIFLEDDRIADDVLYALDSTDPADMKLKPYFADITPGDHYIAISHANGCMMTHSFEIDAYEPLRIAVEQSNINEITANVTGGKEEYIIYFGDVNNGSDNTFMINYTDTYVVTAVDENGCETSANIYIEFIDIEIPNFFTPNGDAENQYWKPHNDEGFPQILTIIFDRYGREVYRMRVNDRGWDGFYRQTELPTGDYWYIIKLNGENDDREFVGHFTLYR